MEITQAIRIIDNLVAELVTDACEVAMEAICDYILVNCNGEYLVPKNKDLKPKPTPPKAEFISIPT
jgi:hypothetical protein